MTRHVYLFMPSYTGQPRIETFHALNNETSFITSRGWELTVKFTVGDALIPRARNLAVAHMLVKTDATDLVMIDDDVVWEPGAIARLLQHDADVVAGVYPKRKDPLEFPCKSLPGAEPDRAGLLEMRMVPTGFLRIRRQALERMVQAYPERAYRDDMVPGGKAWGLFMLELGPSDDGGDLPDLWGEDFTFCRLWRELGGHIYADTLLSFRHIGKKAYEACYAEAIPGFVESIKQQSAA